MTSPPSWALLPDPSVHQLPVLAGGSRTPPIDWNDFQLRMRFFMDAFVGQIAIAFGGIEIAGWKPFEFLVEWGEDLIQQASDAYLNSRSIADQVHQAVHGGSATNTPVGDVLTNLQRIPEENIAISSAAGATAVTFGAAGSGGSNTGTAFTLQATGTHTIAAGDNYVVVAIAFHTDTQATNVTRTVTYGPKLMHQLGGAGLPGAGGLDGVEFFGLANPPAGAQTIAATIGALASCRFLALESASYSGWGSTSVVSAQTGQGTSLSQTVAAAANQRVVQAFSAQTENLSVPLSGYSQTQRGYSGQVTYATGQSSMLLGDAPGAASVGFTASCGNAADWAGIALVLASANPGTVGSGMRKYRASTAAVNGSAGNNQFPAGFFDSTERISDNLSSSGNGVTVDLAGWYAARISAVEASVFTQHYARAVLYRNGAVADTGTPVFISSTLSDTYLLGDAFLVYCDAGDTLEPGYWLSTAVGSVFTGESTGTRTYFVVSLVNRSLL